jgi:hypothetical protein
LPPVGLYLTDANMCHGKSFDFDEVSGALTCECTTGSKTIVGVNGRMVHVDPKRRVPYAALKDDNEIVTDWTQELEPGCKDAVTPDCGPHGTVIIDYNKDNGNFEGSRCKCNEPGWGPETPLDNDAAKRVCWLYDPTNYLPAPPEGVSRCDLVKKYGRGCGIFDYREFDGQTTEEREASCCDCEPCFVDDYDNEGDCRFKSSLEGMPPKTRWGINYFPTRCPQEQCEIMDNGKCRGAEGYPWGMEMISPWPLSRPYDRDWRGT